MKTFFFFFFHHGAFPEVSCQSNGAAVRLWCPLSSKLLRMQLEFLFLSVQPRRPASSLNCKQRGNVKRLRSGGANHFVPYSQCKHEKLGNKQIIVQDPPSKFQRAATGDMSRSSLVSLVLFAA